LLGHVTFTLSYVVVVLRGRLFAVTAQYEEAAMDLGASRWQAMRLVLLPLLMPAILAALALVFAISIDNFVISAFLVAEQSTVTLPVRLYSSTRLGPTPALNALATILMLITLGAITVAGLALRRSRRRRLRGGGSRADRHVARSPSDGGHGWRSRARRGRLRPVRVVACRPRRSPPTRARHAAAGTGRRVSAMSPSPGSSPTARCGCGG
jgi:ABC-type Fe3+ transport system permease subunit